MVTRRKNGTRGGPREARVHGDVQGEEGGAYDEVYAMARRIPRARVMTYGQVATLVENRLSARAVGWAMHGCPEGVPWQRVVNATGGCSTDRLPDIPAGLQRAMLESEGVEFRESGTLDLERYRWTPPEHRARSAGKPAGGRPAKKK